MITHFTCVEMDGLAINQEKEIALAQANAYYDILFFDNVFF